LKLAEELIERVNNPKPAEAAQEASSS